MTKIPTAILEAASKIKLVILDVDGVMTDGTLYYGNNGEELKGFNIQDGLGIKLLQKHGIQVGIITGRVSELLQRRATELSINLLIQGRDDKLIALDELLKSRQESLEEIAFMGDDLPDLSAISEVGLGIAVANACSTVAEVAKWQTLKAGGNGAVRELAEMLLTAQGKWARTVSSYQ